MVIKRLCIVMVGFWVLLLLPLSSMLAQGGLDYSLPPEYGTVALASGFSPDPHLVTVMGGGEIGVNDAVGEVCEGAANGYTGSEPDYRLQYTSGEYILRFAFAGEGDAGLVISAPDGSWFCDDDRGGMLQPMVQFTSPESGQYDIWITSYAAEETVSGQLIITEIDLLPALDFADAIVLPPLPPAEKGASPLPVGLAPGFGEAEIESGFPDDPLLIEVTTGGPVDVAAVLGTVCEGVPAGFITAKPHYRVNYTSGEYALHILAYNRAEEDITLVVRAPDGSFYCDDDASGLLQPQLDFGIPQSGVYDVWLGSYSIESAVNAFLIVTEYDEVNAHTIAEEFAADEASRSGGLDWALTPTFGEASLAAGFTPDPYAVSMVAGGSVDITAAIGDLCEGSAVGFAAEAPDFRLLYDSAGQPLRVFFVSEADTTLAINAPNGDWYCNDDSDGSLNPMIVLDAADAGQYDIWVGTFGADAFADGTLYITELDLDPDSVAGGN